MKEKDIIYEKDYAWVFKDTAKSLYTVFRVGATHSTSDSSYALDADGLSLAKARVDYFAKQGKAARTTAQAHLAQ